MVSSGAFKRDDLVLAKMRGFAPWPAMIVEPDQVPADVLDAYYKPKRPKQRIVRFMPAADYAFYEDEQLTRFSPSDADAALKKSTTVTGSLRKAYNIARFDAIAWARENDRAVEEARAGKSKKGRKQATSKAASTKGGRGKRAAPVEAESEEEVEDDVYEASPAPAAKRARRNRASASDPSLEVDSIVGADLTAIPETEADSELSQSGPPDAHQVKLWRFELQRIFLGDEILFDSMEIASEHFDLLEAFTTITAEQIQYSKINKVLKKIFALKNRLPAAVEAKYRFTTRASRLLQKWKPKLAANSS